VKRRLKIRRGTESLGLDQLGESLLPLALFSRFLWLDAVEVVMVTMVFVALDVALARLRHRPWLR